MAGPPGAATALHRDDDLEGAEAAFSRALELAPERCDVRFNLVVTIEAQGDQLDGGRQREVEESTPDGLARYRVALDIADAGLCPASTAGDAANRLDEARQRLRDKLGAETSEKARRWKRREQRDESEPGGRAERLATGADRRTQPVRRGRARGPATSTPPRSRTREPIQLVSAAPGAGVTPAGRRAISLG